MIRRLCLLVTLVLTAAGLFAAVPASVKAQTPPLILKVDSGRVQVRYYDSSALATYSRQPEFQYHEDAPTESWWDKFWRWFWSLFKPVKVGTRGTLIWQTLLKYFFIILGLSAIAFIILKVTGMDISTLFSRKPAEVSLPYNEAFENIHEIDFDAELDRAVAQHNYRLAVRLLYLKALKQLDAAGLINWQLHKTNSAYINELQDNNRRGEFSQLTRQFEYVWYGEFNIDAQVYQRISTLFQNFRKGLA